MTAHETELIRIIRESGNKEQAMITAMDIILSVLMRHGSSEEQAAVVLREQA